MLWPSLLALSLLHNVRATPTPHWSIVKRGDATFTVSRPEPIIARRQLNLSESVFLLQEISSISKSSRVLLSNIDTETSPLRSIEHGLSYAVPVELSGESYPLIFDTGSSDLWVAKSTIQCYNEHGNPVARGQCHFGPLFPGTFDEGKAPNVHVNIPYGSGELVEGYLGYEDVTVAGVTVDHQEIALISKAFWRGDGVSSGILGFAFSSLTSAYRGSDLAGYSSANLVHYTNFIGNVVQQGKVDPSFSVVLARNGGQSQVAIGGLPTIDFDHDFTSVPLEIYQFDPREGPVAASQYTYYTIELDAFVLGDNDIGSNLHVIVDSGTTLTYLPAAIAKGINGAFDPPAQIVNGIYETACDATPPSFAIRIGGTNFQINAADLIPPRALSYDPETGRCATGIQTMPPPYVLGGTFLKNVVAVFDIGAAEMRFAAHVNY